MKKLLVVLLALFAVTGIFAQATVNGYVRGIEYFNNDGVYYGDRLRLNLSWTSEDKNVYFFSRLQASAYGSTYTFADNTLLPADSDTKNDTISSTDLAVSYLYGQITLANGIVKAAAGKLGNWDYRFSTGYSNYNLGNVATDYDYIDGVKGFQIELFPVTGLSFVATAVPDGTSAVQMDADNFYAAGKYVIDGIGTVVFDVKPCATDGLKGSLDFKYTGVTNLGAAAGFKYNDTASGNGNRIVGIFDYALPDTGLKFQLAPEYYLDKGLYMEGAASYKTGDFQFNLIGAYDGTTGNLVLSSSKGTYFGGLEALYNIGKGQFEADVYYGENTWSIMITEKVSF